jgi:RNA polymerase sigma-70 factor (ECF subfamily)
MQLNVELWRQIMVEKMMTETELIKSCVKKNPRGQRKLYEKYSSKLMTVCLRYCSSKEEAEDAFQEGFVKIFTKISEYKFEGSFEGWMRRVMVNNILDLMRKNKKHLYQLDVTEQVAIESNTTSVLDELSAADLMDLIKSMPEGYRTIFNLFAIEGYSHKEIADMLGFTESTSKSQFLRARNFLKKRLEELEFTR